MKLACADASFPLLAHEQALELIRMFGLDGVDICIFADGTHVRPQEIRADVAGSTRILRNRLAACGLELSDLFLIPGATFAELAPNHHDARMRAEAAALFRDVLALATSLGVGGMTLLPGIAWPDETYEDSLNRSAAELAWRVEEGRAVGVGVSIEPHVGSIVDTPAKVMKLLQLCPGLELTLDYSHFVCRGVAEDEIEALIPYARHFHARGASNGHMQTTLRNNTIDYERIIDLALDRHYDGFICIEYGWLPDFEMYDMTNTDNVSETILLRDLVRRRLEFRARDSA